jgi:uncharacterized protein (DUF4415 family)
MKTKQAESNEDALIAKLMAMAEEDIDTVDIPEAPADNRILARRASQFRPIKQPVTIRLDADVIDWFKAKVPEGGYQTEINRVLRGHMVAKETIASKKAP